MLKGGFISATENSHIQAIEGTNPSQVVIKPTSPRLFLTDGRSICDSEDAMVAAARDKYNITNNYYEAVTSPQANQWIGAMTEENTAIDANNVKDVADYPADVKPIGSQCVFDVREDLSGERFKARLVCKGFPQQWGTKGRFNIRLEW